jgi:hypothetical protein
MPDKLPPPDNTPRANRLRRRCTRRGLVLLVDGQPYRCIGPRKDGYLMAHVHHEEPPSLLTPEEFDLIWTGQHSFRF